MSTQEIFPTFIQIPDEFSRLSKWMFEMIEPYIKGKVLEVDSGTGSISSVFAENTIPVHLSDPDKKNRDFLREKFKDIISIKEIYNIDFLRTDFEQYYSTLNGVFSTIVALNISEHGFYKQAAQQNAAKILRKNGHLIIAVPPFTAVYSDLEISPEEWKIYNRKSLKQRLSGFQILKTRYFSLVENIPQPLSVRPGFSALVIARKL